VWSTHPKEDKPDFLPEAKDAQTSTLSPNGRWMIELKANRNVRLIEVPSFREVVRWSLPDSLTNVLELAVSSDATQVACCDSAGTVVVMNSFTRVPLKTFVLGESGIRGLEFSREGAVLAACDSSQVVVWSTGTYSERCRFRQRASPPGTYSDLDLSSDGRRLGVRFGDGRVAVYRDLDRDEPVVWKAHRGYVMGLAFFQDGRIATAGADARLKTWDVETQRETVIGRALNAFFSAALDLDSGRLASGAGEGLIRIYDLFVGTSS